MEQALGQHIGETLTAEFHQTVGNQQTQQQRS
ncbi:MAG: hypothetical protein ABR915_19665 [Thermoguttaceae bacterium]